MIFLCLLLVSLQVRHDQLHEHTPRDHLLRVVLGPWHHWVSKGDHQCRYHLKMAESLEPKESISNKDVVMLLMDHFKDLTIQNNAYQRELANENNAYQRNLVNEKIEFAIQGLCGEITKVKDALKTRACS